MTRDNHMSVPFRKAKSGISPAPKAYVPVGSSTSSTVQMRREAAKLFMVVGEEKGKNAGGLWVDIAGHDVSLGWNQQVSVLFVVVLA